MIDCGADWIDRVASVHPDAIVVTHAHTDHVDGLRRGAPAPVYATADVWTRIESWPIREPRLVIRRRPLAICGIVFEAFAVHHSLRAPAVGFRISAGRATIFYVPDVLVIHEQSDALNRIDLYIGDGAGVTRPVVRKTPALDRGAGLGSAGSTETVVGHASMAMQLDWCAAAGIRRAIFTHCGTAMTAGPPAIEREVRAMGRRRGIDARVVHDGLSIDIR